METKRTAWLGTAMLLWLGSAMSLSSAQNVPAPKLFGSSLKTEDVLVKSNLIFVGEVTKLIKGPPAAPGMHTNFVEVKVLQVLKGSAGSQIRATMDVFAQNAAEAVPQVGDDYLFFVEQSTGRNKTLKLLSATDDNTAKVNALIAAPHPK